MTAKDAGGLSRAEVEEMSLQEQFELCGQRYVRMQELITAAQRAVYDDTWVWSGVGMLPGGGGIVMRPLPGGTSENSYYLRDGRSVRIPGASGAESDLEPMRAHFVAQGWAVESSRWEVSADTGDGWDITYGIQTTGQYYIRVYSHAFWGRTDDIAVAIDERTTVELDRGSSLPGDYALFPKWTDPIVTHRDE